MKNICNIYVFIDIFFDRSNNFHFVVENIFFVAVFRLHKTRPIGLVSLLVVVHAAVIYSLSFSLREFSHIKVDKINQFE
jgi:hypothetical protein